MSLAERRPETGVVGSVPWVQECNTWSEGPYPTLTPEEYYPVPFTQKGRFNTTADLVNYVCAFDPMSHPSRRNYFDPICPFPYINSGWDLPVSNTSTTIVFDDCKLKLSDASPNYNNICLYYFIAAFFPIPWFIYYLKVNNDKKEDKKKAKRFWFIPKPNTGGELARTRLPSQPTTNPIPPPLQNN